MNRTAELGALALGVAAAAMIKPNDQPPQSAPAYIMPGVGPVDIQLWMDMAKKPDLIKLTGRIGWIGTSEELSRHSFTDITQYMDCYNLDGEYNVTRIGSGEIYKGNYSDALETLIAKTPVIGTELRTLYDQTLGRQRMEYNIKLYLKNLEFWKEASARTDVRILTSGGDYFIDATIDPPMIGKFLDAGLQKVSVEFGPVYPYDQEIKMSTDFSAHEIDQLTTQSEMLHAIIPIGNRLFPRMTQSNITLSFARVIYLFPPSLYEGLDYNPDKEGNGFGKTIYITR